MVLVKIIIESIPQSVTMISIIINQLTTGYPKMQILYENYFTTLLGVNGSILCIFVVAATVTGYSSALLETVWGRFYPMSVGILGGTIITLSLSILLLSKLILLATAFSSVPYLSSAISLLELGSIFLYLKMAKKPSALVSDLLPSGFSLANIPDATLNDKKNKKMKCYGLPNVIIFHFAHLLFIYLPLYFSLRYIDPLIKYKSVHSDIVHMIGFVIYLGAVIPFAVLVWIFRAKCNRWLKLNEPPLQTERLLMHTDIDATVQDLSLIHI